MYDDINFYIGYNQTNICIQTKIVSYHAAPMVPALPGDGGEAVQLALQAEFVRYHTCSRGKTNQSSQGCSCSCKSIFRGNQAADTNNSYTFAPFLRTWCLPVLINYQLFSSEMFPSWSWRAWCSSYTVETPGFLATVSSLSSPWHTPWE